MISHSVELTLSNGLTIAELDVLVMIEPDYNSQCGFDIDDILVSGEQLDMKKQLDRVVYNNIAASLMSDKEFREKAHALLKGDAYLRDDYD